MMLIFKAEFRKFVKFARKAPLSQIPVLIFLYVFFWLITLGTHLLQPGQEQISLMIAYTMIGYIIWIFAIWAISNIPHAIFDEVSRGTFEHLHLGKADIKVILIARSLVTTLENLLTVVVFVLIVGLIHRVVIFENVLGSLVVFLLTIPGLYGFAYVLAAMVLVVKGMGRWLGLVNFLIILPVILPAGVMPEVLSQILRYWPVYQAAYLLRMINVGGPSPWVGHGFTELVIGSATFFAGGLLLFDVAERVAKRRGTLGLY
jgi:ABC-2 type transport system permease protein